MRWIVPTPSEKHSRHCFDFRLDVREHSIADSMNQVIARELPVALRLDFDFIPGAAFESSAASWKHEQAEVVE